MNVSREMSPEKSNQPHLGPCLKEMLFKLGLTKFYPNKLTLQSLLKITSESITDITVTSIRDVPQFFLRRLMMVNAGSRSYVCVTEDTDSEDDNTMVNPLDLITALFLCADSFLQQEMSLKMSMCQFAVPLLLPQDNSSPCTLMIWALWDIVKEWRPHSLSESKGFVERSIISAPNIPFISFVRLRECSLSKSETLNKVLSNSQHQQNIFTHREMESGNVPRSIANGLVEATWYLPCGNKNLDVFTEPVTIANLRGDIFSNETQLIFLTKVSKAIFVFLDSVEEIEMNLLSSMKNTDCRLFLVVNSFKDMKPSNQPSIEDLINQLKLEPSQVIRKTQSDNKAKFSNKLRAAIQQASQSCNGCMTIELMLDVACELGLSVDEFKIEACKTAKEAVIAIMKGIGVRKVTDYKKKQLPLQGEPWKRLAKLEKEECRLLKSGDKPLEEYKEQLKEKIRALKQRQREFKVTTAMNCFITTLSTSSRLERPYFLKWLRLKLDVHSRDYLSELRGKFKDLQKHKQDKNVLSELDQQLLDSSLGIEHYIREVGQIYEASVHNSEGKAHQFSNLPGLAAELLLDGFPLELIDGDACNIPVTWIKDVLMELHRNTGERSRLLVVTVLGVQSTGKSTLLNTMFGVHFPVSSGRCTRGAFMLFLQIGEDLREALDCEFILLIDTEGLKSSEMAQLDDSYEHDNELATLVIGLSDITIVNIAMENSTEMKDILQIVVHAFLRMKTIGKKPICQFVHQNVSGVSAPSKTLTERTHLLDQLNEMTQIAAEMEKQTAVSKFTDVIDYDLDKNNWYIPGLWHGTPPMAPVNTGYSEAVYEFKQNLIEVFKSCRKERHVSDIPEFLEWTCSLWKAVKYENFIFSFRNTLVAHAYDNLSKAFSEWEWAFSKHMHSWRTQAEVQISNSQSANHPDFRITENFVTELKNEASKEITNQENKMKENLREYYKRKDKNVHLVDKYKAEFFNSIKSLRMEIERSVNIKLDAALDNLKNMTKVKELHAQQTSRIEAQVLKLLKRWKGHSTPLSDEQLTEEFDKMWNKAVVNIAGLKERDIASCILKTLHKNLKRRKVNEDLQEIRDLNSCRNEEFKVRTDHLSITFFRKLLNKVKKNDDEQQAQNSANKIIENCKRFIQDSVKSQGDYHDTLTNELLDKVDNELKLCKKLNTKFEVDLKLHICGFSVKEFLQMHRKFLRKNDPLRHLEKFKEQYLSDFLDLYRERDDCQRKSMEFTKVCLRPAVIEYVHRSLGIEIVDAILTSSHSAKYSSRSYFQFSILKELLDKDDFQSYVKYLLRYEIFVKDWILTHIITWFSQENSLGNLKNKSLVAIMKKIRDAIEVAEFGNGGQPLSKDTQDTTKLVKRFCQTLSKVVTIPMDAVDGVLFQITSKSLPFAESLSHAVQDLEESLRTEFFESDISDTLESLPIKPQDELFKRVFGCGNQCPFCKVPCEAGGMDHKEHHASVHRPKGLGRYRHLTTNELSETICTSCVHSEQLFRNSDTDHEDHPYKHYRTIYPDWNIPPDRTIEASDYWKYVLVRYNHQFAEEYKARAAKIPDSWRSITREQAQKSLNVAFNINSCSFSRFTVSVNSIRDKNSQNVN